VVGHDQPEGLLLSGAGDGDGGLYNTVGFQRRQRGFLSIPGAARCGAAHRLRLAGAAVAEHRLDEDEAVEVAHESRLKSGAESVQL